MYCRYCGKELPNDSIFCPKCGAKQNESISGNKIRVPKFLNEHNNLLYAYIIWFLVHLTLFINSSKDNSDGFYPWNKPLNDLLNNLFGGGKPLSYSFSLLDKYNVYDLSEFFFYTILLPVTVCGIVKYWPNIISFARKRLMMIKEKYSHWQSLRNEKKKAKAVEVVSTTKVATINSDIAIQPITASSTSENIVQAPQTEEEKESINKDLQTMPLFQRFLGSLIDKVLLVIIFAVGYTIISPYGAPGKMGRYIGLLNSSPEIYEYIDRAAMNNYGTYQEGVSKGFQDLERDVNGPPHIGSTMEQDISITFSFIILNLLYYILFESILSASLGKRLLGGVLLDSTDYKIDFGIALLRGICGGFLMSGVYLLLHLQMGLSNYVVIFVFFLLLDLPVFFTKRSLLDICTCTTYVK